MKPDRVTYFLLLLFIASLLVMIWSLTAPGAPSPLPRRAIADVVHLPPGDYEMSKNGRHNDVHLGLDWSYICTYDYHWVTFGSYTFDGRTLRVRERHWLETERDHDVWSVRLDSRLMGVSSDGHDVQLTRVVKK